MMASITKEVAAVGTNEKRLFELERELTMAIISGKYKATILWNLGWKGPILVTVCLQNSFGSWKEMAWFSAMFIRILHRRLSIR